MVHIPFKMLHTLRFYIKQYKVWGKATSTVGQQKGLSMKTSIFNKNTSLVAPGALANRLQRRTARKANEANLDPPNQKSEITSL